MSKKVNRINQVKVYSNRQFITSMLVVLAVALAGCYLLFGVRAASDPWRSCCKLDSATWAGSTHEHAVGSSFSIPVSLIVPGSSSSVSWKTQVEIYSDDEHLKYEGYACDGVFACNSNSYVSFQPFAGTKWRAGVCLNMPNSHSANTAKVMTLRFKVIKEIKPENKHADGRISVGVSSAPTTCDPTQEGGQRHSTGDSVFISGPGPDGSDQSGEDKEQNSKSGDEEKGRGTDNDGEGKGQGASTGGGGSGGSIATHQTNKPGSVASSSGQGTNDQPDLVPSPFYDGQQYEPGSASDDAAVGTVSSTSRAIVSNWPVVMAVVALVSAGSVLYWKKYQK